MDHLPLDVEPPAEDTAHCIDDLHMVAGLTAQNGDQLTSIVGLQGYPLADGVPACDEEPVARHAARSTMIRRGVPA
jgi:hypothetical protein